MSKYYFYIDNSGVQQGPVSLEQLIASGVTASTLVWYEGAKDWSAAILISEIKEIISPDNSQIATPPPLPSTTPPLNTSHQKENITPYKPKKYFVESILVTLFCCLPFGIVSLIYSLRVDDFWAEKRYDEAYKASSKAYLWVKISLFSIIIYPILYILAMALAIPALLYV